MTGQDLGFHVWKLGLWLEGVLSAYDLCEVGDFKIPLARVSQILYVSLLGVGCIGVIFRETPPERVALTGDLASEQGVCT